MTTFEQSGVESLSRKVDNLKQLSIDARESTPLLVSLETERQGRDHGMNIQARCRRRCCLRSKAALLILLWNLIIITSLSTLFDPSFYVYITNNSSVFEVIRQQSFIFMPVLYGSSALLLLFYPLTGYLADVRWGRYKIILNSIHVILWCFIVMVVYSVMIVTVLLAYNYQTTLATLVGLIAILSVPFIPEIVVIVCGFVAFSANVIQYGIDQLHDASTDDSVLYVHWYVWTSYLGTSIIKFCISFLPTNYSTNSFYIIIIGLYGIIVMGMCFLGVTLCILRNQKYEKNSWLLIDSGTRNPYKLVYNIIKFAKDHANPIRRSAFTYCEDELPSRLDLGKEKYGGPFTTEDVENVKAFLGILCVLLSLGPILMVDIAASVVVTKFADHMYDSFNGSHFKHSLIKNGGLTSLMIVILIPLYLSLLRPFILNYIPGMLKRIGLGMVFILLSAIFTLALDTYGHTKTSSLVPCFVTYIPNSNSTLVNISSDILIIQSCLNTVGYLLLYIATYEFICAQSPHSMKGLLIGTFFAIKGVFQLFGTAVIYVPFTQWKWQLEFPSCGVVYYLINVVIGMVGIVAYTCVARKYQYRQRDEPDNIYRYAEEYYANARDEPNYDYDNYDNLNVHTINN